MLLGNKYRAWHWPPVGHSRCHCNNSLELCRVCRVVERHMCRMRPQQPEEPADSNMHITWGSLEYRGDVGDLAQSLNACCQQDQWVSNVGIPCSGPECIWTYRWEDRGVLASTILMVFRNNSHSWPIILPPLVQNSLVSMQKPLKWASKTVSPVTCPGSFRTRKSSSHTHSVSSLSKPQGTFRLHRELSIRPVLQDWENEPFELIEITKHRKSYKMKRQRNTAKMTVQERKKFLNERVKQCTR